MHLAEKQTSVKERAASLFPFTENPSVPLDQPSQEGQDIATSGCPVDARE
jgi:hypothetical protein